MIITKLLHPNIVTNYSTLPITQQKLSATFSSVLFRCSVVPNSLQPHGSQHARLPVQHQLLEFTQMHVHQVSDAIQPSHPMLSPSPPAPKRSQHQRFFFSNESALHMRWPMSWGFSFSIIPSKEIPGLTSFRMDWLDLLAVQGVHRYIDFSLGFLYGSIYLYFCICSSIILS